MYEPQQRTGSTDTSGDAPAAAAVQPESDSRSAPDTRRDRVDFM